MLHFLFNGRGFNLELRKDQNRTKKYVEAITSATKAVNVVKKLVDAPGSLAFEFGELEGELVGIVPAEVDVGGGKEISGIFKGARWESYVS
jgi:hypothetical protein